MGSRPKSKLPILDLRTSSHNGTDRTNKEFKVPKGLDNLSVRINKAEKDKVNGPNFKPALTPNTRLRKFKVIRDKNLRKVALKKNLIANKMDVTVEKEVTVEKKHSKVESKTNINSEQDEHKKLTNGASQKEEALVTVNRSQEQEKPLSNGENGEVSQSHNEKIEETKDSECNEIKICLTEDVNDIISEEKDKNVDVSDDVKQDEEVKKHQNLDVKIDCDKDEINEGSKRKSVTDEEQVEPPVKILRRSPRHTMPVVLSQPSTSKEPDFSETSQQSKQSSDSTYEEIRARSSARLRPRKSLEQIRKERLNKRKNDGRETDHDKKSSVRSTTPSVISPGWTFIKSPLPRFWTPQNHSMCNSTPYKSPLTTPYTEEDCSMAVNFDDKSLRDNLEETELDVPKTSLFKSMYSSMGGCNLM